MRMVTLMTCDVNAVLERVDEGFDHANDVMASSIATRTNSHYHVSTHTHIHENTMIMIDDNGTVPIT
jgi:hypothetical protein